MKLKKEEGKKPGEWEGKSWTEGKRDDEREVMEKKVVMVGD